MQDKNFVQRVETLKKEMLELGYIQPNLAKGCSEQEIQKLQQEYDVIFPTSYIVCLKNFGHSFGGDIFQEIDFHYESIFKSNQYWRSIFEIDEIPHFPEKSFVIASRYGGQCVFFNADGTLEEPPIFNYLIGEDEFIKSNSDTVFDVIEGQLEYLNKLNKS